METNNRTLATEFVLLGFSRDLTTNIILFILFAAMYFITCIGNVLVICIIIINSFLHKPMYFFLCNLAILDLCYSSNAAPRLLTDLFSVRRIISLSACTFQLYFSLILGGIECLFLAIMAYDRYVAICHPLYYTVLMSWKSCYKMTITVWIGTFLIICVPSLSTPVALCNPNQIEHFMCEVLAILNLACGKIVLNELLVFSFSFILILFPFILILASYICIVSSILKVKSIERGKAFSTCTSHLTVVSINYSTSMIMYSVSSFKYLSNQQKYISVIYVFINPIVNPIIYSLKNNDIRKAFKK